MKGVDRAGRSLSILSLQLLSSTIGSYIVVIHVDVGVVIVLLVGHRVTL